MSIVNFAIPATLEKRISQTLKKKGFASKAEFFRFAAIYFMDIFDKPYKDEDARFDYLAQALSEEVKRKYKGKKISSLRDQLKDL